MAFFVDFGNVKIPRDLNVPPSLRMLGVEPQTKLNCEVLGKRHAKFLISRKKNNLSFFNPPNRFGGF